MTPSCDPGTDEGGEGAGWDSPEDNAGGQAHHVGVTTAPM